MSCFKIIIREVMYRKLAFLSSTLLMATGLFSLLISIISLRSFDSETNSTLRINEETWYQTNKKHQEETQAIITKLEDQIRKNMKGLGFNIFIFPEGQNLADVHDRGFASKTMPENYVNKLAQTKSLAKINHLLPRLVRKIDWTEQKRNIIVIGTRGEVPIAHRGLVTDDKGRIKGALLDPVTSGEIVLGYELHRQIGLKVNSKIKLQGKEFTIVKCHEQRGSKDDISVWINLKDCQELFNLEGRISSILALNCNCASLDRLGEVRAEVQAILPGTKVIEKQSSALARAEARVNAAKARQEQLSLLKVQASDELKGIKNQRQVLRSGLRKNSLIIMSSSLSLAILTILILSMHNLRERRNELGIYSANGFSKSKVFLIFLSRSCLSGLLASCLCLFLVLSCFNTPFDPVLNSQHPPVLFFQEILSVFIFGPLIALVAAFPASAKALSTDPATLLKQD